MPQIGILFDAQKLGSGFYGYTAFRILFTQLPPRELAGCTLYHGEVGDGRNRPYCIAVECDSPTLLARVRQTFAASTARGLLPGSQRFLDDFALQEEVLAMAARVTSTGDIADCPSRWLQEAFQRAQGQANLQTPDPVRAPKAATPPRLSQPRLPDRVPLALRWSSTGRRAIAFLIAFAAAGAAFPWLGLGISLCLLFFTAGAIQGIAIRWRLWAEESISGPDTFAEARKLLAAKPVHEFLDKLNTPASHASPLLRRVLSIARTQDHAAACLLADQHDAADRDTLRADALEIALLAGTVFAVASGSVLAMWNFQSAMAARMELARLSICGLGGSALLALMSSMLLIRGARLRGDLRREVCSQWLPIVMKTVPAAKSEPQVLSLDNSLNELRGEFQALRAALDSRRDREFIDTIAGLRDSLEQLSPVLAGFREPFVLQAVPTKPVTKAMSATA
ncbi:MAG: hypothetical protein JST93_14200 [Acidobacteria bacterium]|nr:hypothetical protein [Acidobacteriota bacterium]